MTTAERSGRLWLDSWAGRTGKRVTVIGETPKRYRIRAEEDIPLKGWAAGDVRLVPRHAVTIDDRTDPAEQDPERAAKLAAIGARVAALPPDGLAFVLHALDLAEYATRPAEVEVTIEAADSVE